MKSIASIKKLITFFGDVRREVDKISWPGRKEVVITTVIVFILAIIASLFFGVVDTLAYKTVHFIISM